MPCDARRRGRARATTPAGCVFSIKRSGRRGLSWKQSLSVCLSVTVSPRAAHGHASVGLTGPTRPRATARTGRRSPVGGRRGRRGRTARAARRRRDIYIIFAESYQLLYTYTRVTAATARVRGSRVESRELALLGLRSSGRCARFGDALAAPREVTRPAARLD